MQWRAENEMSVGFHCYDLANRFLQPGRRAIDPGSARPGTMASRPFVTGAVERSAWKMSGCITILPLRLQWPHLQTTLPR